MNASRTFVDLLYIYIIFSVFECLLCPGFVRVFDGTAESGIEFLLNALSERYSCIGPLGALRCGKNISQPH